MASKTFLYDITARFGPDGFVGAHAIDMKRTIDDDDGDVTDKEFPARPITADEFTDLLGGQTAALIQAADDARADRDARIAQALADRDEAIEKTKAECAEKVAEAERLANVAAEERNALAADLKTAQETIKKKDRQLTEMQQTIEKAWKQNEELQRQIIVDQVAAMSKEPA